MTAPLSETEIINALRAHLRAQLPALLPAGLTLIVLEDDGEPEKADGTLSIYIHDGEQLTVQAPVRINGDRRLARLVLEIECYLSRVDSSYRQKLREVMRALRTVIGDGGPPGLEQTCFAWRSTKRQLPAFTRGSDFALGVQTVECDHWELMQ